MPQPPLTEPVDLAAGAGALEAGADTSNATSGTDTGGTDPTASVGARIRDLRQARGISARALAKTLGISPSAVSQIERGVMQPSVSRLIAITDALGVPLVAAFDPASDRPVEPAGPSGFTLQRAGQSPDIVLDSGVSFRRLTPGSSPGVDYFESVYPPGAAAHGADGLFHHEGYEVGTVVAGELTIDFEAERVILRAGDAISYPCSVPHRLHNTGDVDAVAHWLIVHA
ncbi:helix-turn-helix domain-containing protein [Microbacterium trichothecenolyticum]|uniref:Transcriptional regulator with XRE-family HTH domain n=1 Tax=Microbacterium trichothecenolyticum TaxID=69370 RepID=A0ABU0TVU9_MICTR|nr:XRE family transcriptional regulator [Microbacterium trichothecenolyticum]MDQ1123789.1 transcriptional regulator with XRE-family HTH domain [Microbacterium trichothecenolyticum]